jgi:Gp157 protein
MTTELVKPQVANCTIYEHEDHLAALVNTIDLVEGEGARQQILEDIGTALRQTKEKRDAVVAFLRHCELQQKFADAEIERIQRRKAFIGRAKEELERYVVRVIEQFAEPDRRGGKRLEGNVSIMRIQKNPDSVAISDLNSIPRAFKQAVLTMPAYVWEALLVRVGTEDRKTFEALVEKVEIKPDKKTIGAELKKGNQIAGADLKFGDWRLVLS